MIQLNQLYSTPELAKELKISSKTLQNNRDKIEKYLFNFYFFEKNNTIDSKNTIYYNFYEQKEEFIPYKEYKSFKKNKIIQQKIKETIAVSKLQTAANIARIISVDAAIVPLDLRLSTLTVYTRDNLQKLVDEGYYYKLKSNWCYLDKKYNIYREMTEEQIAELRSYFSLYSNENYAAKESIWEMYTNKELSEKETNEALGQISKDAIIKGLRRYEQEHNAYPIKVAIYELRQDLLAKLANE